MGVVSSVANDRSAMASSMGNRECCVEQSRGQSPMSSMVSGEATSLSLRYLELLCRVTRDFSGLLSVSCIYVLFLNRSGSNSPPLAAFENYSVRRAL